jgi:hypothetical protein
MISIQSRHRKPMANGRARPADCRFSEHRLQFDDVGIGWNPAISGKQRAGIVGENGIILEDRHMGVVAFRDHAPAGYVAHETGDLGKGKTWRLYSQIRPVQPIDSRDPFKRDADSSKLGGDMDKTNRRPIEIDDQAFHGLLAWHDTKKSREQDFAQFAAKKLDCTKTPALIIVLDTRHVSVCESICAMQAGWPQAQITTFYTDSSRLYTRTCEEYASHKTTNHAAGEYVRYEGSETIPSNTIEGVFPCSSAAWSASTSIAARLTCTATLPSLIPL